MVPPLSAAPPTPAPTLPDAPAERAAGQGAGATEAVQPGAVAPQAPKTRPPTAKKAAPTRKLRPGDLVCGECGEGNAPTRRFCSRCGNTLEAAVVVKTPWWHRFVPKRKAKVLAAGERPGQKGVKAQGKGRSWKRLIRPIRMVVSAFLLLGTIVYGVYSPFREWVNDRVTGAKQEVNRVVMPEFEPVSASAATANVQLPDHPAPLAVDGFRNTYWSAPPGGAQPTLVLTFSEPVDLDRAIVHNGAAENFQSLHRARELHMVFSTDASYDVTLSDTADPQEVDIDNGEGVTSVEIHVMSFYQSLQGNDVGISEIELFTKE